MDGRQHIVFDQSLPRRGATVGAYRVWRNHDLHGPFKSEPKRCCHTSCHELSLSYLIVPLVHVEGAQRTAAYATWRFTARLCHHPLLELVHAQHFVSLAGVGHLKGRAYGYRNSAGRVSTLGSGRVVPMDVHRGYHVSRFKISKFKVWLAKFCQDLQWNGRPQQTISPSEWPNNHYTENATIDKLSSMQTCVGWIFWTQPATCPFILVGLKEQLRRVDPCFWHTALICFVMMPSEKQKNIEMHYNKSMQIPSHAAHRIVQKWTWGAVDRKMYT